jgi:solute carrier family 25 (adenine nucleotide translocator) protein 4/5/6/31
MPIANAVAIYFTMPFFVAGLAGPLLGERVRFHRWMAIIAGFISYPFDTVRRRLQMQAEKPKEKWLYNGTLDCAVKIVKNEGMGAMFKGFAANVLRTLGGALVLVGYDEIKRALGFEGGSSGE